MAELTMEFFRKKFDLDIVKIMPDLPSSSTQSNLSLKLNKCVSYPPGTGYAHVRAATCLYSRAPLTTWERLSPHPDNI